jgi:hypothetical protein
MKYRLNTICNREVYQRTGKGYMLMFYCSSVNIYIYIYTNRYEPAIIKLNNSRNGTVANAIHLFVWLLYISHSMIVFISIGTYCLYIYSYIYIYIHVIHPKRCYSYLPEHFHRRSSFSQLFKWRTAALYYGIMMMIQIRFFFFLLVSFILACDDLGRQDPVRQNR